MREGQAKRVAVVAGLAGDRRQARAWLEYVVEAALELLDAMDGDPDLEEGGDLEDDREAA